VYDYDGHFSFYEFAETEDQTHVSCVLGGIQHSVRPLPIYFVIDNILKSVVHLIHHSFRRRLRLDIKRAFRASRHSFR
jgi:hypothetical protein